MIKIPNLHTHVLRQVKTEEAEAGLIADFAEEAEAGLIVGQPKKMQKTSKAKPRPPVKVEKSSSSASGQNPQGQWG